MKIYNIFNFHFSLIFIIFINLSLYNHGQCHFFKGEKIDIDLKEMTREHLEQLKLGNTDECLVSIDEAKKILKEKYNINPNYIDIDQNIRFILGK